MNDAAEPDWDDADLFDEVLPVSDGLETDPPLDFVWDEDDAVVTELRGVALALDWSKTLMAVDVDGVVAPLDDELSDAWDDIAATVTNGFPMAFSRSLGAELGAVPASRLWLTTWERNANQFVSPELGWPTDLPTLTAEAPLYPWGAHSVVPSPPKGPGYRWWKLSALVRLLRLAADDPFDDGFSLPPALIWMDDALAENSVAANWAEHCPFPTLLICPSGGPGLTAAEVAEAASFAAAHTQG